MPHLRQHGISAAGRHEIPPETLALLTSPPRGRRNSWGGPASFFFRRGGSLCALRETGRRGGRHDLRLLVHAPAVAGDDGLAGECGRGEGGQEQREIGDIGGGGELAIHGVFQHHVFNHLVLADVQFFGLLGNLLFHQRGTHKARADDVRAHALGPAFLGQHSRQPQQAVLGGDVGALELAGLVRMHRAHINHHAAFLGIHARQHRLGGKKGAVEVDGEQLFPIGEGEVFDGIDDLDAGVRHQNVHRAEGLGDRRAAGVYLRFVGHVHRHAHGFAAGLVDGFGGGVGGVEVQVGDGDFRAGLGIGFGNLFADAAGGSGDDGGFVLEAELHGHGSLLSGK